MQESYLELLRSDGEENGEYKGKIIDAATVLFAKSLVIMYVTVNEKEQLKSSGQVLINSCELLSIEIGVSFEAAGNYTIKFKKNDFGDLLKIISNGNTGGNEINLDVTSNYNQREFQLGKPVDLNITYKGEDINGSPIKLTYTNLSGN